MLVQLEGRNGAPIWINPEHVVAVLQNNESNTYVGQPHTTCTHIELVRSAWVVRGEPEDVIEKLFSQGLGRRKPARLASAVGSD